ncbi:hypothetical protein C8R44DRAFT_863396 [Mycena epipterygia]|nr:hypothetical protein C8R44DRAFT_863396 [Mycena epipterygia]
MALSDIPVDVLMEIAGHLDLPDSLQLVATCATCRSLLSSRYFWIMALDRMEQLYRRPLPCAPGTDIASLPLATLQQLAVHAYKLRKNWASASPRPAFIRRQRTEPNVLKFSALETSHLLLTLSWTRLACWDITSGECVGVFEHPQGCMAYTSDHTLCRGITLLESFIKRELYPSIHILHDIKLPRYSSDDMMMEIAVLQIDHHGPAATISKVFSKNWTAPSHHVSDVAMNEKLIAVVLTNMYDATAFLLFWKFNDTIFHRIPLVADDENAMQPQSLIYGEDIYFGRQGLDSFAEVGRIRTSAVPNDLKMVTKRLDIPFPVHTLEESTFIGTSNLRCPKYGILNVTIRTSLRSPHNDGKIHSLHFWPAEYTGSPLEGISVRPLRFYEHSSNITSLGVGSSGTCVITIDRAGICTWTCPIHITPPDVYRIPTAASS